MNVPTGRKTEPHTQPAPPPPATADGPRPGPAAAQPRLEVRDPREIRPDLLETFSYQYPGSPATVEVSTDEFTAVCPWSGLPDFGTITIRYLPDDRVLELRSFKYYLLSYRNVGIYQEHAANRILADLVRACAPQWMELDLDYRIRGGVHTVVRVRWPAPRP
jgi:7-cyano-7-deazaguanine reductase